MSRNRGCFRIIISFFVLLFFPYQLNAEEEFNSDIYSLSMEELLNIKITTASKRAETVQKAPATVHVITKKDIRLRGYSILTDVLRDLPGFDPSEYFFSEYGTAASVRGISGNNKIIVLVNGMRVNSPGGEEMMFRSDISVRGAERVEVIYGPGSTMYGQDAISAVINIITEKPEEEHKGQVLAGYGNQDYKEAYLSFSDTLSVGHENKVKLSAYLQAIDSHLSDLGDEYPDWWDNYASVAEATGDYSKAKRWDEGYNAFLRLESDNSSVQAWYRASSRSSAEGGYTPILQYVDESKWHDDSFVIEGKNRFALTDNVQLESRLSYNRYEIDPETRYVFPVSDTDLFYDDYKYGIGTSVKLEEKLDFELREDVFLTFGATISQQDIIPKSTIPGGADTDGNIVSQGGTFTYYTAVGDAGTQVIVPRTTNLVYESYGAYLEGRYDYSDAFSFVAGARVDGDSRYDDNPFSPRLAAIYTNEEHNFTAKYIFTKAFVAPSPYSGYNVYDNGVALNTFNADLEPERAISNEINLGWSYENLILGLSAFYNEQDNLLLVGDLAFPANIVTDEIYMDLAGSQTRTLTRSANAGESESKGFEFAARYNSEKVSIWGSYSYVDFESKIGDMVTGLGYLSAHNIRLGLTWTIFDNFVFTPSVIYRSTPRNMKDTFGLDDEIEDPYEINAHFLYTICDDLELFLNLRNVSDHKYALKGMIGPTPQEVFRARAGLRFHF